MLGESLSYSADSPLFAKRVSQFGNDLEKLGDFLKGMVTMMKLFCKDIRQGAKSANDLGTFMLQGLYTSETHKSLFPIIKQFGELFTELSSSQSILAESLERTFVVPLESFYMNEVSKVKSIKLQYQSQRENLEKCIHKYLQSDTSNFGRGVSQSQLDIRAYDMVLQKRRFEITRFDLVQKVNEIEARKSFELAESCVAALFALRTHHHECLDQLESSKTFTEELRIKQQQERKQYSDLSDPFTHRRIEVYAALDSIVHRTKGRSPFTQGDTISLDNTQAYQNSYNLNQITSSESTTDNSPSFPTSSSGSYGNSHIASGATVATQSLQKLSRFGAIGAGLLGGLAKGTVAAIATATSGSSSSTDIPTHNTSNPNSSHVNNNSVRNTSSHKSTSSVGNIPSTTTIVNNNTFTHTTNSSSTMNLSQYDTDTTGTASGLSLISCEECESRMKAFDTSELDVLYTNNQEEQPAGVILQGYLWKKSTSHKMMSHWSRRWFILDESKLFYIKEGHIGFAFEVHVISDVLLTTVKELKNSELAFCFEVVNANQKSTVLQAEGISEYNKWIKQIRVAIEKRLTLGTPTIWPTTNNTSTTAATNQSMYNNSSNSNNRSGGVQVDQDFQRQQQQHQMIEANRRKKMITTTMVSEILQSNPYCADCHQKDPDWVVLNLGCVVCIACSGVHRSLGVHISKVRSLTLDDLDLEEYQFIQKIGNDISNNIWDDRGCTNNPPIETILHSSTPSSGDCSTSSTAYKTLVKPSPNDSNAIRYPYITAKYQYKSFLSPPLSSFLQQQDIISLLQLYWSRNGRKLEELSLLTTEHKLFCLLMIAVESDDVVLALTALAYGADANGLPPPPTDDDDDNNNNNNDDSFFSSFFSEMMMLLPLFGAVKCGSQNCCTLLILNGADIRKQNSDNKRVTEVALDYEHSHIHNYLMKKIDLQRVSLREIHSKREGTENNALVTATALIHSSLTDSNDVLIIKRSSSDSSDSLSNSSVTSSLVSPAAAAAVAAVSTSDSGTIFSPQEDEVDVGN